MVVKYQRLEDAQEKVVKSVSEMLTLRAGDCTERDDHNFWVNIKDLTFTSMESVFDPESGYISPLYYSIRAEIDNLNIIFEENEDNNTYDERVRVYPIKE